MKDRIVLTPSECKGKRWVVPSSFSFAANRALIPLHGGEAGAAAVHLPIAIAKEGRKVQLVAVCGLKADRNHFVSSEGGWTAGYRPAWLHCWPFGTFTVGDKAIVVFDTHSGLLAEKGSGEAFFDSNGHPTPAVKHRIDVLRATYSRWTSTEKAVQALAKAGVLMPWPDALRRRLGMDIDELYLVDERALAALDDSAFLALRKAQALSIAYAINMSLATAHVLLGISQQSGIGANGTLGDLDALFGEGDGDTLRFDY